jgi:hypothetical protein
VEESSLLKRLIQRGLLSICKLRNDDTVSEVGGWEAVFDRNGSQYNSVV